MLPTLSRLGVKAVAKAAGWPAVKLSGQLVLAGPEQWQSAFTTPGERAALAEQLREALHQRISATRWSYWSERAECLGLAGDPIHAQIRLLVMLTIVAHDKGPARIEIAASAAKLPPAVRALAVEAVVWVAVGGPTKGFAQHVRDIVAPEPPRRGPDAEAWIVAVDLGVLAEPAAFDALIAHELGHVVDECRHGEVVPESLAWAWGAEAAQPERYLVDQGPEQQRAASPVG